MPRESLCNMCKIKDTQLKVKEDKKNFHDTEECIGEYRKQKEFKKQEQEQKNELYSRIMKLHGFTNSQEIPTLFYMKIEEIRNDSGLLGKVNKKYKMGVPYNAISYTYQFCQQRIEESIIAKEFDTKLGEMYYCLGIVRNNLVDAYNHKLQEIRNQKENNRLANTVSEFDQSLDVEYKKIKIKKDDMDISSLL